MAENTAVGRVDVERLQLSKAPIAELAATALEAQERAGLEQADWIVVACKPGDGVNVEQTVAAALER